MFKKQLEKDLKAIFKTRAIRFGAVESTLEQDVLCVDITAQKTGAREGCAWARITGTVSIRGTERKNPAGFLTKKVSEADAVMLSNFWFGASETPVLLPLERELKAYKLDFTYFYQEEYAPTRGMLQYAKVFWQFITGD